MLISIDQGKEANKPGQKDNCVKIKSRDMEQDNLP